MKALELEDEYQVGELFADDLGQVMSVEKEIESDTEEVTLIDNTNNSKGRTENFLPRNNNSKDFNTCYICFLKNALIRRGADSTPPPYVIGTGTHTTEAQTPIIDKNLIDFLYKNFESTKKYKQKAGKLQTKLKKAKQDLKEAKKETQEVIANFTKEATVPRKTANQEGCNTQSNY